MKLTPRTLLLDSADIATMLRTKDEHRRARQQRRDRLTAIVLVGLGLLPLLGRVL